MWKLSENPGIAAGTRLARRSGVLPALGLAIAALTPLSADAHCNPSAGHFECVPPVAAKPSDPVPGGRLVGNVTSKSGAIGSGGAKVKAELVNQRYENNAQQRYHWVETALRLPVPAQGIANKAEAQAARPTLRLSHASAADGAYAECTLEPTKVSAGRATYSLGLKWNAAETLLRWGRCDDPQSPGFDSLFPVIVGGDTARLLAPNGALIAEFAPPIAVDVPPPAKLKKQKPPATARLMEGGGYQIKQ